MILAHFAKPTKRGKVRKIRPVRPNRAAELAYKTELLRLVRAITASINTHVVKPQLARAFAVDSAFTDAMALVRRSIRGLVVVAPQMATRQARRVQISVDGQLAANVKNTIGVNIQAAFVDNVALQTAVQLAIKANVALITSIAEDYLGRVQSLVETNLSNGLRYESLVKEIQRIGSVTESRAKLIARDQTSKMNSSFNKVRQQQIGISQYTWSTSGDERVRDSHASKNGQVFSWDLPPEDTGHPGDDVQCRCVAIPVIS